MFWRWTNPPRQSRHPPQTTPMAKKTLPHITPPPTFRSWLLATPHITLRPDSL